MRYVVTIIASIFFMMKSYAGQFSMTAYVYYNTDKICNLSESNQVWFWHNKGIFTTSFGVNAKSQCRGTNRVVNNELLEQFFMCEGIDSEGERFILEFNSIKGVVEAGVQKVSIVSGTGRWAEVVGVQCLGAYSTITPFDEGTLSNATAMWKGKCDVADKTLDRLINFNR